MLKHKLIKLKNGLTLILQYIPEIYSVSISVGVKAGSCYETKKTTGLAHFLEHMLFEGTKKFPTAKKLAEQIEKIGGCSSAYTNREYVIYNVKISKKYLETAFEYLSQIIFSSILESSQIEKEKNIVLEEIKRVKDNPEQLIWEEWMTWIWGVNQTFGRSILGDEKSIQKINRDKLSLYLKGFYIPKNIVVTVVGNFSLTEAEEYAQKYFGINIERKTSPLPKPKLIEHKVKIKIIKSDTQQVQLLCGFITDISYFHKDRFAIWLLVEILSGGISARIFNKLIYELGIAYSVGSYNMEFNNTGIFYIFGGFSKENIKKAIKTIFDELKELQTKKVSIGELVSAKERSKAKLYFSAEKSDYLADLYTIQFLNESKINPVEELLKQIDKVNAVDIKRVAKKYFNNQNLYIMLYGSVEQNQTDDINHIICI